MIQEEVQDVFVERSIIVKQENIARRNYKIVNWLKLLTLQEEDKNFKACDEIIREEIHQNFVMQEGFWFGQTAKRLKKADANREDIELLLLAFDDGNYLGVALQIAEKLISMLGEQKLKETFVLSVLQRLVALFSFDASVGHFFKYMRDVHNRKGATVKIRSTFERELRLAHDNFDLVWDEYKLWETDVKILEKNQGLYDQAKKQWERKVVQFDEGICSELNVKLSLIHLQNVNESRIDEGRYLHWLQKLPTESEKLWFLRRIALNYRQMFKPYLLKLQGFYQEDEELLIKKYKVVIRLADNNKQIELKYLHFLARRISKHLLNESLPEGYNESWSSKVVFFREEIAGLIEKKRGGVSSQEQSLIFEEYYRLWIQVEEKIVRDKESVCQLYQNLLKDKPQGKRYEDYAESLMYLGAIKQAKNVLKRYRTNIADERSKELYIRFLQIYGNVEEQVKFYSQVRDQNKKDGMDIEKQQIKSHGDKNKMEIQPIVQKKCQNTQPVVQEENNLKRIRVEMKDELQEKIYDNMRKRLHVDADYTVFLKGIPTVWSESDVLSILVYPGEVSRVSLVNKNGHQQNYCYIEYKSKQSAELEIKDNKSGYKLFISKPPSEYDEKSTLFVCALPQSASEEKVRSLFGEKNGSIIDVRLKLDKEKNYAYVQFQSQHEKQLAFQQAKKHPLIMDGKKIIVQYCDSSRAKTKKFIPVVFLKNLAFKASESDIREFFAGKSISKLYIPLSDSKRPQGFAYVQFQKFKDYQDALDMRKGSLHGRQFTILRSDRQITEPHSGHRRQSDSHKKYEDRPESKPKENEEKQRKKGGKRRQQAQSVGSQGKDNNYFSKLFK